MHLEKLLNILHYCIYVINVKLYFLFLKVTLLDRIFEIPFFKRRLKKRKQDPLEYIIWYETNKHNGSSIINSAGLLAMSFSIIMFSMSLWLNEALNIGKNSLLVLFIIFSILSYLICEILVLKKDKYLTYFDEFEKWPRKTKRRNVLLSFGYLVGVNIFFFWSLLYS